MTSKGGTITDLLLDASVQHDLEVQLRHQHQRSTSNPQPDGSTVNLVDDGIEKVTIDIGTITVPDFGLGPPKMRFT
jgi:hypothetical protein